MKKTLLILSTFALGACTHVELAPKMVMPTPPEILMRAPQQLSTINNPGKPAEPQAENTNTPKAQ